MLPGEIIGAIIHEFAPKAVKYGDTEDISPDLTFSSKELSTCSLVDREWCRRCRRVMFKSLHVRSSERLSEILDAKAIPMVPLIPECVENLYVYVADPTTTEPWIHRVVISNVFGRSNIFTTFGDESHLTWSGEDADFMAKLPRRLPRSLFCQVWQCHFVGATFDNSIDFLRPVTNLPKVYFVRCQSVTFLEDAVLPHMALVGRAPPVSLRMKDCRNFASAVELLRKSFCFRIQRQEGLPFPVLDALTKATAVLFERLDTRNQITVTAARDGSGRAVFAIEHQVAVRSLKVGASAATSVLYITLWDKDECLELLRGAHWANLERTLVALNPLPNIELETSHLAHFAWIADGIAEGRILQDIFPSGRMKILFRGETPLSMQDALRVPLERAVGAGTVTLTRRQAITIRSWNYNEEEEEKFFRKLAGVMERRQAEGKRPIPAGSLDSDSDESDDE